MGEAIVLIKKIIEEIEAKDSSHVLCKKEVLYLLKMAREGCAIEVSSIKRGDVFWHKLIGGKMRPWVTLSCRDGLVTALSMTSEGPAPRMVKTDCRFWSGYIGVTASIFEEEEVRKYVAHPYTNADHLREVEAHAAALMGLRTLPGGKRNLDIPDQVESRQVRRFKKREAKKPRTPEVIAAMSNPEKQIPA